MRLTKAIRDSIKSKVPITVFNDRITQAKANIMIETTHELLEVRKIVPYSEVPEKLLPYVGSTNTCYVSWRYGSSTLDIPLPVTLCRPVGGEHFSFGDRYHPWDNPTVKAYEALITEKEEFTKKLSAVLNSCTSVEQLQKTLPELEPFLPKEPNSPAYLVAVETVNAVRGLLTTVTPPVSNS